MQTMHTWHIIELVLILFLPSFRKLILKKLKPASDFSTAYLQQSGYINLYE